MALEKSERKRLNQKIEKIGAFEEQLGIHLENITATTDEFDNFIINGDLSIDNPRRFIVVEIHATLYDVDNDIIATNNVPFLMSNFLGFETFKIHFFDRNINLNEIEKIRVYPKGK